MTDNIICTTIFSVSELGYDLMKATNSQTIAERLARENGQSEYFFFPKNHTFFVKLALVDEIVGAA